MPRNPNKRRCAHPGCRAWAMRGGTLCSAHAGRSRLAGALRELEAVPGPSPQHLRLTTLEEEIALLADRRNRVDAWVQQKMDGDGCEAGELLRYLTVLTQVGKSLALMLVQRAAGGGAGEIERFFETVAERVRELGPGGEEANHE